jgi:hypothetical protein
MPRLAVRQIRFQQRQRQEGGTEGLDVWQKRGFVPDRLNLDDRIANLKIQSVASGLAIIREEMEMIAGPVDSFDERQRTKAYQRSSDILHGDRGCQLGSLWRMLSLNR